MTAGIVGDGIMGRLLAFALVEKGWKVTLYGAGEKSNCSMTAAGLLTPFGELEKNDPLIFHLGLEALTKYWPLILKNLPPTIYFRQLGSLLVSHPRDHEELKNFISRLSRKLPSDYKAYCQLINHKKIEQLEPELSHFQEGYYFPLEGQIDNQSLLSKLHHYLKSRLTWLSHHFVTDIASGRVTTAKQTFSFDMVFDCRGLGATATFPSLRSVRGEIIWLHAPEIKLRRPIRYLHPRYNLYIVPRPKSVYLLGATEIESADDSPISVRTTLELLTAAYGVQPKFAEARIVKTATQNRPTLPNHLPIIKFQDRLAAVNGLYRHGFLIAPVLAANIMQRLDGGIAAVSHPELFE